jgi:hypothetical protein
MLNFNGLDVCPARASAGFGQSLREVPEMSWTIQMSQTAAPRATGTAAWAAALLSSFAEAGYVRAEPPILQPAEPFLDLSGEDIRKSLYLTTDAGGEELCAPRPDHSGGARLPRLEPQRPAGRLLLPRPGVPLSRRQAQ